MRTSEQDTVSEMRGGRDATSVREAWIEAVRLRTLPLAASGSIIAAGIGAALGAFRLEVFALMFTVSALLQVIANFADDYGDLASGLDDETRVGPKRGMQRGIITPTQMRRALAGLCLLTLALGCLLIAIAVVGSEDVPAEPASAWLLLLGLAAIAAAILYTVGPHPYGYLGLGDIMSFIFFGPVAVVAGSFLYTHQIEPAAVAAGIALGLPVAAVMNINNMRDSVADAAKGKRTIANRLLEIGGERAMRTYHSLLVITSVALFITSIALLRGASIASCLSIVIVIAAFAPLAQATRGVCREADHELLDRFMAPTSLGTVLVALAYSLSVALIP